MLARLLRWRYFMAGSISASAKKRGRPATTGTGRTIGVRILPELISPLDAWIADQPDPKPSRPEAIRHALTDWLIGHGYVRHREDPEGTN